MINIRELREPNANLHKISDLFSAAKQKVLVQLQFFYCHEKTLNCFKLNDYYNLLIIILLF
jgi:hypothetical protein